MKDNPKSRTSLICKELNITYSELNEILDIIKQNDYAEIYINEKYMINFSGKLFVDNYYKNIFKGIFKNYLFQIILALISFGLGLLSGLLLK